MNYLSFILIPLMSSAQNSLNAQETVELLITGTGEGESGKPGKAWKREGEDLKSTSVNPQTGIQTVDILRIQRINDCQYSASLTRNEAGKISNEFLIYDFSGLTGARKLENYVEITGAEYCRADATATCQMKPQKFVVSGDETRLAAAAKYFAENFCKS
ncbi:hypothetical protein [Rhizobium rhizoryzae]|uniref:hypothetical protein n=1 Tax=Rhizobium rhizoryzae TaxID=451876 RepID=UPI0028AA3023|nr:hypothetical protein [Rhizobium rhizoryzae]